MCGIAGFTLPRLAGPERMAVARDRLRRMVATLHHRGPDDLQGLLADGVALGHARLSILDPAGGGQPMRDDRSGVTIVFNGEIFNHVELREGLASRHAFRTHSDTEVVLASYLSEGIECVSSLNGQFAFAIHDPRSETLWLARDRFGERPLFYAESGDGLAFASEAKALFAGDVIRPSLDARALIETLHFWSPAGDRSAFEGVRSLPPASVASWHDGALDVRRYWSLDLSDDRLDRTIGPAEAAERLEALLEDAVRVRLRADVPVGAYLSGGLDSSLVCAIAQKQLGGTLQTFSISFAHERYDERRFQESVADALGTSHHAVTIENREIGQLLPAVVDHAETILLRTAAAPMWKLSRFTRECGTKVVLSGEGADEMFLGYDLFKETRIRSFWAKDPASKIRPRLLERLYPYLEVSRQSPQLLRRFFEAGLDATGDLDVSHRLRWTNSGRVARFLSPSFVERIGGWDPIAAYLDGVPAAVRRWRPLARAQHFEHDLFLSRYLLSSQGDRMLMAHSVEGRLPFLDHRVAEFAASLPDSIKLRGLTEKAILRRIARGRVPPQVLERTKFPFRAPIGEALVGRHAPGWAAELLTRDAIDAVGVFDGAKFEKLAARVAGTDAVPSDADDMALAAVATTQLLATRFLERRPLQGRELDSVRVNAA